MKNFAGKSGLPNSGAMPMPAKQPDMGKMNRRSGGLGKFSIPREKLYKSSKTSIKSATPVS